MKPELFLADIERKPETLGRLAASLAAGSPWSEVPRRPRRVVFLGMGSSRYAAEVAALRLRARGVDAVAEYASAQLGFPADPDTLVVAISATGGSVETLDAVERYAGRSPLVALTNRLGSAVAARADHVVDMLAEEEVGGVACRSFAHTGLMLRALEAHLAGDPAAPVADLAERSAVAVADLLDGRPGWLADLLAVLDGPDGVYFLAPAERWSSAAQSALMVREGPRRVADAGETGDWSHVDVYLTKTRDYRAVMYPGSRYDAEALRWMRERGSTVVSVGAPVDGGRMAVRYRHDEDPDVAVHAEVTVAELVAASWWLAG